MAPFVTASKMQELEMIDEGIYKSVDGEVFTTLYDLYAVVHHNGALGSGHYVATVKDSSSRDGLWYCYNDEEVGTIREIELDASPSAYLLFYARRDVRDKGIDDIIELCKSGIDSREQPVEFQSSSSPLNPPLSASSPDDRKFGIESVEQLEELSRRKNTDRHRKENERQRQRQGQGQINISTERHSTNSTNISGVDAKCASVDADDTNKGVHVRTTRMGGAKRGGDNDDGSNCVLM